MTVWRQMPTHLTAAPPLGQTLPWHVVSLYMDVLQPAPKETALVGPNNILFMSVTPFRSSHILSEG